MALTGIQIQKLLPKTNCKECGSNTCLAFAMKLAAKKTELSACPYASEEAKRILGAASEPPVRNITLGADSSLQTGGETVLYRHEKTFVHQTLFAVNINDTDPQGTIDSTLKKINDYVLERAGEALRIDMVCISQNGNDHEAFAALAKKAMHTAKKPLILRSPDISALRLAAEAVKGTHSVLVSSALDRLDELKKIAEDNEHNLALSSSDLDALAAASATLKESGFKNIVLDLQNSTPAEQFQLNSIARRMALRTNFKPLGYPTVHFIGSDDLMENVISATIEINKYGGICVFPVFDPALFASLMTVRLNIYTDPQKPIQVEPKIYAIGEPTPESRVFVTTNFSLTYFIVSSEIENSGISAWLVVPECEGMSVLTAWAAGKFSGAGIAKFCKETGLENQVKSREIIIPGYVAQISGELEENLPGWKVIVGPQEAADIESFVKAQER